MTYDAIVVGGGFFGASVAHYLRTRRGFGRVLVLEREPMLLARSSFVNQARVHGGYHYPRSFTTAYRSRVNMPRFHAEFGASVFAGFTSLYAIARRNSKVTTKQMERFCQEIGAWLQQAPPELAGLFDPRLVEKVYLTEEHAFDADILRTIMERRLAGAGVETWYGAQVEQVAERGETVEVCGRREGEVFRLTSPILFNCTYSQLQRTVRGAPTPDFRLRHEIAEVALVRPPAPLREIGITLMDGPFFSTMPFPARRLHSLTHVRYTPHLSWTDSDAIDPAEHLERYPRPSGIDWMIRDSARYVPCLIDCEPVSTMFEVKTVLLRSEGDDSRPILFERHGTGGRIISILGGKIDNIFDIIERLDLEQLDHQRVAA